MVFARYFMSTLLPLELNCPFSDCRVRLSSVDLVQEGLKKIRQSRSKLEGLYGG